MFRLSNSIIGVRLRFFTSICDFLCTLIPELGAILPEDTDQLGESSHKYIQGFQREREREGMGDEIYE